LAKIYSEAVNGHSDLARAAKAIQANLPELRDEGVSFMGPLGNKGQRIADAIAEIRDRSRGRLYEVDINAEPDDFLDWDRPLSEQSAKVQNAYNASVKPKLRTREIGNNPNLGNLTDVYIDGSGSLGVFTKDQIADVMENPAKYSPLRGDTMARDEAFTASLREAGIPGIKYLDQGSRGAADGTRNYVVFDDSAVNIINKAGFTGGRKPPVSNGLAGKGPPQKNGFGGSKPLPMDEGARMGRAREQGFDTDKVWHHSDADGMKELDPNKGELGLHVGDDFAAFGVHQTRARGRKFSGRKPELLELYLKGDYASSPDLQNFAKPGAYIFARKSPRQSAEFDGRYDKMWKDLDAKAIDIASRHGDTIEARKEWRDAVHEAARSNNISGWEYLNEYEGGVSRVVFQTNAARRTDATFDPSQSKSSKLLAGVSGLGGVGLISAAATTPKDETKKPRR